MKTTRSPWCGWCSNLISIRNFINCENFIKKYQILAFLKKFLYFYAPCFTSKRDLFLIVWKRSSIFLIFTSNLVLSLCFKKNCLQCFFQFWDVNVILRTFRIVDHDQHGRFRPFNFPDPSPFLTFCTNVFDLFLALLGVYKRSNVLAQNSFLSSTFSQYSFF